jgi:hypothetical protein
MRLIFLRCCTLLWLFQDTGDDRPRDVFGQETRLNDVPNLGKMNGSAFAH